MARVDSLAHQMRMEAFPGVKLSCSNEERRPTTLDRFATPVLPQWHDDPRVEASQRR